MNLLIVEVLWRRLRRYSINTDVYACPICGASGTVMRNSDGYCEPPTCKHRVKPVVRIGKRRLR